MHQWIKLVHKWHKIWHGMATSNLMNYLSTECVTDLDLQSEMIIFGSILTTFESSRIFGG